jgi:hypothetical protein
MIFFYKPGLYGVHYTIIQKSINRLPINILETTILYLASIILNEPIIAIIDSTYF